MYDNNLFGNCVSEVEQEYYFKDAMQINTKSNFTSLDPLYVIQHLFDEAQILVDNVFEQTQIKGDNTAASVTKPQWEYLHKLGQEVRKTLENVS